MIERVQPSILDQKRNQCAGRLIVGMLQCPEPIPDWFSRITLLQIATETQNLRTFLPRKKPAIWYQRVQMGRVDNGWDVEAGCLGNRHT